MTGAQAHDAPRTPLSPPPPGLKEFAVGQTFQISARGTVALAATDPDPWWPVGLHRVRVTPPEGAAFDADAPVEALRSREGGERMGLLLLHVQQADVPVGSRILSLGYTPHPPRPAPRRWWQFWK